MHHDSRNLASEVPLGPSDGLPKSCVVNLDNISLVDTDALGEVIAVLDHQVLNRICAAVAIALGCDQQRSTAS